MVLPTSGEGLSDSEGLKGLSKEQAAQRLHEDGPNALPDDQRRTSRVIIRETLQDPMFMLLLAAGLLYLLLGDLQEGLILFGLVLVVLTLTLYQEGKTERALAALRDLASPRALVLRGGQPQRIAARDVVRGEILVLSEGDRIAADAVVTTGNDLQVDESLLTGEAVPAHCWYAGVPCRMSGSRWMVMRMWWRPRARRKRSLIYATWTPVRRRALPPPWMSWPPAACACWAWRRHALQAGIGQPSSTISSFISSACWGWPTRFAPSSSMPSPNAAPQAFESC